MVGLAAPLLAQSPTAAQEAEGQTAAPTAADSRQASLFFLSATVGLGDCNDTICGGPEVDGDRSDLDTSPHLGFGAGAFIRPFRYLAAGVNFHYNIMNADHLGGGRHSEDAGIFARKYPRARHPPDQHIRTLGGLGIWLRDVALWLEP